MCGSSQITTDDMNKLVMDYLITEGYRDAAEKFCEEAGLSFPHDSLGELNARIEIRVAIANGSIQAAIQLINQLAPELLDNDRMLHFSLLQQHLIELIRAGDIDAALQFAQEYLVEKGEQLPKTLDDIEKTLALLAFDKPDESPFGHLMQLGHRAQVAAKVNSALLASLCRPSTARIEKLIKMVLWSQHQLDRRSIAYTKMNDIATAQTDDSKPIVLIGGAGRHDATTAAAAAAAQRRVIRRDSSA